MLELNCSNGLVTTLGVAVVVVGVADERGIVAPPELFCGTSDRLGAAGAILLLSSVLLRVLGEPPLVTVDLVEVLELLLVPS